MKEFFKTINNCHECDINQLRFNERDYRKGYGKLLPFYIDDYKSKVLLVGLNPSYRRFPRISRAFGGNVQHNGTGWEFYKLLRDNDLIDKVVITNLMKCSVEDNSPQIHYLETCYQSIFTKELELIKPKKIICLGSKSYDFIITKHLDIEVRQLYHPVYWISYHKITKENYLKSIKNCILR